MQQKNLQYIRVDEKFKFGPSGPYKCSYKIRFPIGDGSKVFWCDISIVDADIPMLLGNNILKPLEAKIQLFKTGNGILKLNGTELDLRETSGGHYNIKVSDLGRLCVSPSRDAFLCKRGSQILCDECDKTFENEKSLENHMHAQHGIIIPRKDDEVCENKLKNKTLKGNTRKSAFRKKQPQNKQCSEQKHNTCLHSITTELNTLLNGAKEGQERKLVLAMKNILIFNEHGKNNGCDQCENISKTSVDSKNHIDANHEDKDEQIKTIFLSHHEEEVEGSQADCADFSWDILLSEDDANDLTEEEKNEVLKFHRYFAHRSGHKLWQNLFQPAGILKGKKRLVVEFLENCDVCRKYRRTPGRPRVGLPKSKDFNEIVSMDLKIFQKDGKKHGAGILKGGP